MRKYRVIQYGTGATGKFALRSILTHPSLELVGVGVHNEAKVGQDAGAFCRMPDTGVRATNDIEALLALRADCLCFMPWDPEAGSVLTADSHSAALFETICRFLARGTNVIASAPNSLVYAPALDRAVGDRLEAACAAGGASFLYVGVSPGFMPDRAVLGLTATSSKIDRIFVRELMNYADYANPDMIMGLYGFGQNPETFDFTKMRAIFAQSLGGSVAMIADGLEVPLEAQRIEVDFATADRAFDIASGHIGRGTIAAERIRALGIVAGEPRIIVEHQTRISEDAAPDWPYFGGSRDGYKEGYQVEIHGSPSMRVEIELGAFGRNPMADAGWAVGGHASNSIVDLCQAPVGVRTFLDMPAARARHRLIG